MCPARQGVPDGLMRVPQPTDRDSIFLQHYLEDLQAGRHDQLLELDVSMRMSTSGWWRCGPDYDWSQRPTVRDCFFMTAPFWGLWLQAFLPLV